ncbi:LodA/GoxA family CTQ-dependent oxidase [Flavivirga jejuensis]|uniref:LodA/GoxA family CTQ-dependent oxidase n=1 Tax=Flavivirga jejuensis TaxID=870487 RepID=A0ABT8WKL9_9FLAO|nr:LodA/GoxA family CTQ-dependent oxidase [Flavivirga jejuensis]MDO5973658.1 LodA/GoxA family CTQ-dependent oxidase [Flavivirga jejuensis]
MHKKSNDENEKKHPIKGKPTANNVKCWDSEGSTEIVTQRLKEMFVEMGQKTRIEKGQKPAERSVFRKQHGIAYGDFIINDDIPEEFKKGIFAGKSYKSVIRFSSDTAPTSPDLHTTIGVGLKLFGVDGPKLLGEGTNADFIFQNIDRFFASDAQQMCSFTTAGVIDRDYDSYINKHPKLAHILQAMLKEEASCLSASYWAILPFKLGESNIVKYRLVPDHTYKGAPFDDNNYLKLDLEKRLRNGDSTFRFEIQLRTDDATMPLNDAQVVWNTEDSPYICIAKLHLPQQDVTAIGQAEFGRNLSFNIWRTLEAHKPLGSIADARKTVYEASSEARHQANGQQQDEPKEINPPFEGNTDENSNCIVRAGIYPPIGVMRVGNSDDAYFIGPLVDQPEIKGDPYAYRDETGAIKRQAAQFRIYGFNAAGKAVKELTMENANITWHSHLANQKSSWYQFHIALDIPDASNPSIPPSLLRNIDVKNRDALFIDGKKERISKPNVTSGKKFKGKFMGESVYLGEMRTDEKGRLIMLGGHGKSENINGDRAITFANNEGWYDDISDGPVTAEVEYEGVKLNVDPSWVICAPPDYAPMQKSVRTMWDLMRSVAVESEMLVRPERPSFVKDILPIFERMTNLQWVNAGFAAAFGWNGQFNYTSNAWVKKLNDPSSANYEMRRTISNNFRRFDQTGAEAPQLWPWLYGDAVAIPSQGSVRQHSTLSKLQLQFLDQWVEGDFDADFIDTTGCPYTPPPKTIDDYPIDEQPDMLTKAAMDFCLADAFHPGCEMTWPMRTSGMYSHPFRLKHAPKNPKTDYRYYGSTMNGEALTSPAGPLLGGQVPGGVTRWMAIPWQTDTASCRDGYTASYDPYLPTFWPARVPNNILSEERYKETLDQHLSEETRKEAFAYRYFWLDDLPLDGAAPTQTNQINSMVKYFDKLAIVQHRPGVNDNPNFPTEMQIGVIPNEEQNALLLKETENRLRDILNNNKNLDKKEDTLLQLTLKHLSNEGLLNEGYLLTSTRDQLLELVKDELVKDEKLTGEVEKLINLLASEAHKFSKTKTVPHARQPRKEVGVPERLVRFQTYIPK